MFTKFSDILNLNLGTIMEGVFCLCTHTCAGERYFVKIEQKGVMVSLIVSNFTCTIPWEPWTIMGKLCFLYALMQVCACVQVKEFVCIISYELTNSSPNSEIYP